MESIEGSHGTSVSRSKKIQAIGFQLGRGRAGTGVYFWLGPYYIELAIGWYNYLNWKKEFQSDEDSSRAVIIAKVTIKEQEIVNLTEEKLNNKIAIVVKNRKIDPNNERALANLHDQFIMELERDLGLKFKAVKIRVAPPPPPFGRDYPIKAIGAPLCCVARETNCISIVSVKNEQR